MVLFKQENTLVMGFTVTRPNKKPFFDVKSGREREKENKPRVIIKSTVSFPIRRRHTHSIWANPVVKMSFDLSRLSLTSSPRLSFLTHTATKKGKNLMRIGCMGFVSDSRFFRLWWWWSKCSVFAQLLLHRIR